VRDLLALSYDEAREVLSTHRDQLERLTAELIKHEAMDGQTFYKLIGQEQPAIPDADPGIVDSELNLKEVNQHAD
jgi:ATP-dependent Zn protease